MDSKYQVTYTREEIQDSSPKEQAYQETAASVSEVDPYQFGQSSSKHSRDRKRWWTKFVLTIFSAILLGSLFGFLLLRIFSHEPEQPVVQDPDTQPTTEQPSRVETDEIEEQPIQLASLTGFVIQAGAFQELEQASLAQELFLEAGYSTLIWKTDTDHRVFIAVYQTNESAKQIGEQFTEAGFDVYAREWESAQGTLTTAAGDWLIEFQDLWQQSLADHTEEVAQAWREWTNVDQEQLSEELKTFYQHVTPIVTQFDQQQLPYTLLELWYAYHQLIE